MDESKMLYEDLIQHPPADWLIASYLGYKAPGKSSSSARSARNMREAARANSAMLGDIKAQGVKFQRNTLAQMPAYIRTPDTLAMIERMKAESKAS